MNETLEQPQRVWTCQKCGRKMPIRLDVCRCGVMRQPGTPDEAVAATELKLGYEPPGNSAAPASGGILQWAVLITVAVIAAGALVAIQIVPVRKAATPLPDGAFASQRPQAPASSAPELPSEELAPAPFNFAGTWDAPGGSEPTSPGATAPAAPPALEDVVSSSIPAIVSIETREGRGSGFFAAADAVITNRHVVGTNTS